MVMTISADSRVHLRVGYRHATKYRRGQRLRGKNEGYCYLLDVYQVPRRSITAAHGV